MIAALEQHAAEIVHLCRQYGVRRLEVFGSAANGEFDPAKSDIDLLVDFDAANDANLFHRYFGLMEDLERLLGRKVDLVSTGALRNPYLIAAIDQSRQTVYAAPLAEAA
jgi:hypothetical protein